MTNQDIVNRFKKTIDQWYAQPNEQYNREHQLHHIGGILQAALHILPTDSYFALKQYVYDKHGYDPGGCRSGQISFMDLMEREE